MTRKRKIHNQIYEAATTFHGVSVDPTHQERTDGFCFQVNYSGAAITEIVFTLKGSIDYTILAEGSETWIDVDTVTCTTTSGSFFINTTDVFVPYFRLDVEVTGGGPCETLTVFQYSLESN